MTVTDDRFAKMKPFNAGAVRKLPARDLPPGPRWPALLQSVALMRFRHQFIPAMHKRYGDTFTVRTVPKAAALVLFTRPEDTKEIFAGDPEIFHAGKGNAILGPIMGEHSLLLLDSGEHRRARKLLMPAFSASALRGYESVVTALAKEEVARWTPGVPFRSLDRMNALTLEVIMRVVFGVTDESRLAELRPLVNRTVDINPVVLLGWGYPFLQKFGPWKRTVDNQRALDAVMYAEIAGRRRADDLQERTDVLSQLLNAGEGGDGLSDAELRDQLVTLLLAGHETTATALSWSLYELGRDPSQLAKARTAAATGDDDYLEAVLKEAMRLHPVIPMVVRHLMAPATIGGRELPRGANVGPSIIITHAREDNYDDPSAFRPERFTQGHVATNTWIPFGGGVRRCIGAGFSLMEGVAVLREVLGACEVALPGGAVDFPKVRNITSVPRHGARIVVRPAELSGSHPAMTG
jgi:cytochrome P450